MSDNLYSLDSEETVKELVYLTTGAINTFFLMEDDNPKYNIKEKYGGIRNRILTARGGIYSKIMKLYTLIARVFHESNSQGISESIFLFHYRFGYIGTNDVTLTRLYDVHKSAVISQAFPSLSTIPFADIFLETEDQFDDESTVYAVSEEGNVEL